MMRMCLDRHEGVSRGRRSKTFSTSPVPHGDNHDVWINPKELSVHGQGNDGGANVSLARPDWSPQPNQPTAEIYQVAVDDQYPYRVYGRQGPGGPQHNCGCTKPSRSANGQDSESARCETGPISRPDNSMIGTADAKANSDGST